MSTKPNYLLDSNVFIEAKSSYYAFDICPGFWDNLILNFENKRIFSIDKVRGELLNVNKEDDLAKWVKSKLPSDFFLSTDDNETQQCFTEMMLWVQRNSQLFEYAKAEFATAADGWLAACAKTQGYEVVTMETSEPNARRSVKLPNVCDQFGVKHHSIFYVLKDLGVKFK